MQIKPARFDEESDSKQALPSIASIQHAEPYQIDNQYIHTGYRINYCSPKLILRSLFQLHNELLNVWTHLIGSIISTVLIIYICLCIQDLSGWRVQLLSDINQIFSSVTSKVHLSIRQAPVCLQDYRKDFQNLLHDLDLLQNMSQYTHDNYHSIVQKMTDAQDLFSLHYDSNLEVQQYKNQTIDKFLKIKTNLVTQIDSHQFDWVQIYKQNYTSILDVSNLKRNQQLHFRSTTDPNHVSRWPIILFLISAIICLLGSSLFHLFFQMSPVANKYLMRVDYAGISLLIFGSVLPPIYYGFYCDPFYLHFYAILNFITCTSVYVISIFDFIHTDKWRKVKGVMYAALGLLAGVTCGHLYLLQLDAGEVSDVLPFAKCLPLYIGMGASYLVGLAIYVTRVPERFLPGCFDLLVKSALSTFQGTQPSDLALLRLSGGAAVLPGRAAEPLRPEADVLPDSLTIRQNTAINKQNIFHSWERAKVFRISSRTSSSTPATRCSTRAPSRKTSCWQPGSATSRTTPTGRARCASASKTPPSKSRETCTSRTISTSSPCSSTFSRLRRRRQSLPSTRPPTKASEP